ncbi:MAG: hypothetical protein HYY43_05845 [Deltaproteobacteria bacterium]|nr:hypothetical protein [Deltaproteobacteria bacterium]
MKKYIIAFASLAALTCMRADASSGLWGVDTGGIGDGASSIAVPTEILGIKIILFKAADYPEIFKSDLFLTSVKVKYADKAYLKIKAFEVLESGEKELKHSPNYNDTETTSYCDNNDEKLDAKQKGWKESEYSGTQELGCTLTAGANPGLTLDSKIKYKFYSSGGVLLGETSPVELKLAEDGPALVTALVSAVAKYNTAVNGAPYNPPKDYKPSTPPDTDSDGQDDVVDDFPSVANEQ